MFRMTLLGAALGAAGALAGVTIAYAHITLENQQAAVGASYKAVLRVPHGCDGSATVAVHVRIPEGFLGVKPMLAVVHAANSPAKACETDGGRTICPENWEMRQLPRNPAPPISQGLRSSLRRKPPSEGGALLRWQRQGR